MRLKSRPHSPIATTCGSLASSRKAGMVSGPQSRAWCGWTPAVHGNPRARALRLSSTLAPVTITDTPQATFTSQATPSPTIQIPSATVTDTQTQQDTFTQTQTQTVQASSDTATPLYTPSFTPTMTLTVMNTAVLTATGTKTAVNTVTLTRTVTAVMTAVNTLQNTAIATAVNTPSFTPTPDAAIATPTPDRQYITEVVSYPNPVNPFNFSGITIRFNIGRTDVDRFTFNMYTSGYRLVRRISMAAGAALQQDLKQGYITCPASNLMPLSGGIYYYVIEAQTGNKTTRSKVEKILIIR